MSERSGRHCAEGALARVASESRSATIKMES